MSVVEVSARIEAPPERVWELIGDPTRMGEWSPECQRVEWIGGAGAPAVDARFRGHNRKGWRAWSTTSTISRLEHGREIAWEVSLAGFDVARWSYRIDAIPGDQACTVVESFTDRRNQLFVALGPIGRGVRDTDAHNRDGMEKTLARVKAAAEAVPGGS